jgi:hypothetical protein
LFVARRRADGSLIRAGSIELGLRPELMQELDRRLAELPAGHRGALAWYPPEVSVVASVHGLPDGAVRDAVLREIMPSRSRAHDDRRPLPTGVHDRQPLPLRVQTAERGYRLASATPSPPAQKPTISRG